MKKNILTLKNVGESVTLNGWVKKIRFMGDLIFIDLRNINGITQLVANKSVNIDIYEISKKIRNEDVISIVGKVVERKNKNKNIPSGEIEIEFSELEIISKVAKQLPMIIDNETDALEPLRMEYRYLDLRREVNSEAIIFRSKFNSVIRNFLEENNFLEIETPVITAPTPGGANELKVLSSNHEGKEFSLVQSPQIYKQLLMYSGFEKYYQIAKSFRDEDSRADRQLEFTQLDIEASFVDDKYIQNLIENLVFKLWKEMLGKKITIPFKKMSYKIAMESYGSDKPDLRFENKLNDLTELFSSTKINFIKSSIEQNKKVKAIFFDKLEINNSKIKKYEELMKSQGASGLAWLKINGNDISGSLKAISISELESIKNIAKENKFDNDFVMFVIIDENKKALELLGRLRVIIASEFELFDKSEFNFLWVIDFPAFELNSNNELDSVHNPFTKPKGNLSDNLTKDELLNMNSFAYDLVLNGNEIGGGSIRINDKKQQIKVFEILGIKPKQIDESFGWMLKAYDYGIPNHAGIALGIDRVISLMLDKNSIRDVIAFPKSTKGTDEMTGAPYKKS